MTKHWWAHATFFNVKWVRKFHIVVVETKVKEMYKNVCGASARLLLLFFWLGNVATVAKFLDQTTNQKRHLTKYWILSVSNFIELNQFHLMC